MKKLSFKIIRPVIGIILGGGIGFISYRFVGCRTGACPILSNPYLSVLAWAMIGFVFSKME